MFADVSFTFARLRFLVFAFGRVFALRRSRSEALSVSLGMSLSICSDDPRTRE
jgi:hypothetical protein